VVGAGGVGGGGQGGGSREVVGCGGHIRVQYKQPARSSIAEEEQIEKNDTIVNAIKQNSQVISIHPFATKYAVLKTKEEMESVLVKAYDKTYDSAHLKPFIKQGRWLTFSDSTYSREIILSEHTARQLNLKLNDRIMVGFIRRSDTASEDIDASAFRRDKLTVVGIYKTGIEDYDKQFAIGDLKLVQRLNGCRSRSRCSGTTTSPSWSCPIRTPAAISRPMTPATRQTFRTPGCSASAPMSTTPAARRVPSAELPRLTAGSPSPW
ncbi:ABC transporter permease, partial [uncultured Arthrobacter sp.]|uniref:ABC transporter permease n=1 Tax=uncultured Arthrobacter sp. TaxID=114050 RepID=UPI00321649AF